jgi:hypothetical protein
MHCYNISLHDFFLFFLWFFSFFLNWYLSILFFLYWASWEFNFVVFSKITLWIVTVFPLHGFCFAVVFPSHVVFLNYLCWIYFFNVELWALAFPIYFFSIFFCFFSQNYPLLFLFYFIFFNFFSKLFLSILFFYYWAGWKFSFLVFFFKTLWIAIVFPHKVFFNDFFVFFFRIIFVDFFFILSWLKF